MLYRNHKLLTLLLLIVLGTILRNTTFTLAQEESVCDIDALLEHQREHAAAIDNLEHVLHDDFDAALENLYVTGIAYQALAVGCGFNRAEEAAAAHAAEHETDIDHTAEDDQDRAVVLEAARSIGDPENGELLFNTLQPEVSFACATCHRVDTTERLIGPGLWGVGNPEHDPSEHDMGAMDMGEETDHSMDMGTPEGDGHMMDMAGGANDDPAEYIRTSIINPSAFLVPGFPDNLMPKTYGEIFTPDEVNDLIAYLMTLQ